MSNEYTNGVIRIPNINDLTPEDEQILLELDLYPPQTQFRPGNIFRLKTVPPELVASRRPIPVFWQVRFVVSLWAYEMMAQSYNGVTGGVDRLVATLDAQRIPPTKYRRPYVYAHGFPHALNPDTAHWFFNVKALEKVVFRDPTQDWPVILDEASAPYCPHYRAPFVFDLAPSRYDLGQKRRNPFSFEDSTVHSMALMGFESHLFSHFDPQGIERVFIDPEHDIIDHDDE
jgi:hypothetical protein